MCFCYLTYAIGTHCSRQVAAFRSLRRPANGNVKIIRELVRYGAKVDPPGKSGAPLFSAVKNNNFWTVKAGLEMETKIDH